MIRLVGSDHTRLYREVWLRVLLALESGDDQARAEVYCEVLAAAPASWDKDLELAEEMERLMACPCNPPCGNPGCSPGDRREPPRTPPPKK